MAQKNKLSVLYARYMNNFNVARRRRIELRINYLKGLVVAYQREADSFLHNETQYVTTLYDKKLLPYKRQLSGESVNDLKRDKLVAAYDKKLYWQRRRYKTSISRKHEEVEVKKLLEIYDVLIEKKRKSYLKALQEKYPHQKMSESDKIIIEKQMAHHKTKMNKHLERVHHKYARKLNKVKRSKAHNKQRLEKMIVTNEKLGKAIIAYNQKRHQEDKLLLQETESKLKRLKDKANKLNRFDKKRLETLTKKVSKIKAVMHMIEDDNIHLSINHLKMYFGGVKAVDDLSFDVKRGEIFGLIGPNGAGKTTVFNCITQFYRATNGHMIFNNKEGHIVDLREFKVHDMISEGIARSFQNVELIWELTVLDNLLVAAHSLIITNYFDHMAHTPKWRREELVLRTKGLQILKDLDILDYAFRSPYGLPYGVLKKVELARTLMTNPSLIILDEPAAGLNDAETAELARVIKKINQDYDVTIFLVEHDMGLVMSICDRICAISFGKRIGLGIPKEIQENPEVRKAYLGDDDDE